VRDQVDGEGWCGTASGTEPGGPLVGKPGTVLGTTDAIDNRMPYLALSFFIKT